MPNRPVYEIQKRRCIVAVCVFLLVASFIQGADNEVIIRGGMQSNSIAFR